jgi:hypothetical protein
MRAPVRRRLFSIAAISIVAFAFTVVRARRACAQNAAAEALFDDGERLLKEGKVPEACDAFAASNKLEARAGTLLNLAMCREQNGQLATAWSAYKDAGTRATDAKKQQFAAERAAALEARLSYLTISVPDESRVDGLALTRNGSPVDAALWNRSIPVDGGTYVIAGHAPGHEEWSTTVVVPVEKGKISVEVPRFKDLQKLVAAATPTTTAAPNSEPQQVDEQETPPAPSIFTPKRKIAIGVAGVAVAALAGGIVLGQQAKGYQNDAYALCPDASTPCADGNRANDLMDKARSRALFANVSYGVAAASLIGAGVLWFLGAPVTHESAVAVTPRAGVGTASIDVTVRF